MKDEKMVYFYAVMTHHGDSIAYTSGTVEVTGGFNTGDDFSRCADEILKNRGLDKANSVFTAFNKI